MTIKHCHELTSWSRSETEPSDVGLMTLHISLPSRCSGSKSVNLVLHKNRQKNHTPHWETLSMAQEPNASRAAGNKKGHTGV